MKQYYQSFLRDGSIKLEPGEICENNEKSMVLAAFWEIMEDLADEAE
jgi:hypothetical protein